MIPMISHSSDNFDKHYNNDNMNSNEDNSDEDNSDEDNSDEDNNNTNDTKNGAAERLIEV